MRGAIARAEQIAAETEGGFIPQQFMNPANPRIHRETTAEEIWADSDGTVDLFVACVGSGGTVTGVGQLLKERKPGVRIVAVEPTDSPVLSGGAPGPHTIQGIGAGFVPGVLDTTAYDEVVTVCGENTSPWTDGWRRGGHLPVHLSGGENPVGATEMAARGRESGGPSFRVLRQGGAVPQQPLFASTL